MNNTSPGYTGNQVALPAVHGPERDRAIVDRIRQGNFDPIRFAPVAATSPGHTATFNVFADALKMDGVRIGTSARVAQQIADLLGCALLTPRLLDLTWMSRSVTLAPSPATTIVGMNSTASYNDHSARIDALLARTSPPSPLPSGFLIQTVGKIWALDNDAPTKRYGARTATNYGWHWPGSKIQGIAPAVTPGLLVIQDPGWAHDLDHDDYSQTCVLVSRQCIVDGQARDYLDVIASAELAPLCSHQGVLHVLRQGDVPVTSPILSVKPEVWLPLTAASRCPAQLPPIAARVTPIHPPFSPLITQWSERFASYPIGTMVADTVAGLPLLARVECIWMSGGDPYAQQGAWQKGVGLYAPTDANGQALSTPPAGWPGSPAVASAGGGGGPSSP